MKMFLSKKIEDAVNITKLRNNIKEYYEIAARDGGTVFILRGSEAGAVLINKERYNSLHKLESFLETLDILADKKLSALFKKIRREIKAGKWKKWKTFKEVTGKLL